MSLARLSPRIAPLALLLIGTFATASIVPFMGVYIVEGLGKEPLHITLYALIVLPLTLGVNRHFGARIDAGRRIAPLLIASMSGYVVAVSAALVFHSYPMLLLVTAPCMALSNGVVSTMYSYGRLRAEHDGWDVTRYNSYLRATTSLGWMIGPALSFSLAGAFGQRWVFVMGLGFAGLWLVLWVMSFPKEFAASVKPKAEAEAEGRLRSSLWLAAGVCFLMSLAHAAASGSIPLFVLTEVHLPASTPGVMLSVKTLMEVIVILLTPAILRRMGAFRALCLSAILAAITYMLMSGIATLPRALALAALEGVYYGLFAAVGLLYMQSFAGRHLAGATALYMNALFLGALIATPIMGVIAQFLSFGMNLRIGAACACLALLALGWIAYRETRQRRAVKPAP
nr:MFS transporter [uncultured Celeribacter sp.]